MRKWLLWLGGILLVLAIAAGVALRFLARRFEPYIREQTIAYLEKRFDSQVELAGLSVSLPLESPLRTIVNLGDGTIATVRGRGLALRQQGRTDLPPILKMDAFTFRIDLGSLRKKPVNVTDVELAKLEIHIPPKGERRPMLKRDSQEHGAAQKPPEGADDRPSVLIDRVIANGAKLVILPKDADKDPLRFDIHKLTMRSAGPGQSMPYDAELTNAKPPGLVRSKGHFGPWAAESPSQSPLDGEYTFDDADLGVFKGIAGKLNSTGKFHGTLGEITVDGEARVPQFRLTSSGNPVPLTTKFHAIVNGTNGDTLLEPVDAVLGKTRFSVRGGVVRYAGDRGKTINLDATFREGYVEDAMRLAVKGQPPLRGPLKLKVAIDIPPGPREIADKLRLAGEFSLPEAHFTTSTVQDKIDQMSRQAQGKPKNESIDEVPTSLKGKFRLADGVMRFPQLEFVIPGAEVALTGEYRFAGESMDFRGTLRMDARLSQTQTGWKRWALKPIDPFFAKDGAGTVAKIKVSGTRDKPEVGRDK